jgi:hypothetical protein
LLLLLCSGEKRARKREGEGPGRETLKYRAEEGRGKREERRGKSQEARGTLTLALSKEE